MQQYFILLQNHAHFPGLEGVLEFFRFMDLDDHILGVFRQVQSNVLKKLQQERCLPVFKSSVELVEKQKGKEYDESELEQHSEDDDEEFIDESEDEGEDEKENLYEEYREDKKECADEIEDSAKEDDENEEKEVEFALPSSIVSVFKAEHKDVVTPKMLKRYLNLNYIHAAFQNSKHFSSAIFKALGVTSLSRDQLIEILKAKTASVDKNSSGSFTDLLAWIGKWMAVMATILQHQCDMTDSTRDQLQALKMVPLSDDSLVALKDTVVFFPVDHLVNTNGIIFIIFRKYFVTFSQKLKYFAFSELWVQLYKADKKYMKSWRKCFY